MDTKKLFYKSNSKQHLFFEIDGKSQCLAPGQTLEFEENEQLAAMVAKKQLSIVAAPDKVAAKSVAAAADKLEEETGTVDLASLKFEGLVNEAKNRGVDVTGMKSKEEVRNAIEMDECEKFAELHEEAMTSFITINNIAKPENLKEFKSIIERFKTEVLEKKD